MMMLVELGLLVVVTVAVCGEESQLGTVKKACCCWWSFPVVLVCVVVVMG